MPDAILLLAHGTPDILSEMSPYLANVTNGRPMPAAVIEELQHRYAEIGLRDTPLPEGPPLTRWTLLQARLLSEALGQKVYVGMRNWHPYIADTLEQMRADGVTSFRAICLAPQNSRTSVGLYRSATLKAKGDMQMEFVAGWSNHPLLAQAFAERLQAVLNDPSVPHSSQPHRDEWDVNRPEKQTPILFTAHSVPCRTIMSTTTPAARPGALVPAEGIQDYGPAQIPDPYPVECKQTAAAVAKHLNLSDKDWFFAFQSQGIAGAPWIGPTVEDTLKSLAAEGHTSVIVQPIGFLCDHVEILYDIDISFKQTAADLGLTLHRPESLNASPTLIRALAEVATGQFPAQIDEPATTE
jgi:protoporphyrin/coproporphyrin ferrochelatase